MGRPTRLWCTGLRQPVLRLAVVEVLVGTRRCSRLPSLPASWVFRPSGLRLPPRLGTVVFPRGQDTSRRAQETRPLDDHQAGAGAAALARSLPTPCPSLHPTFPVGRPPECAPNSRQASVANFDLVGFPPATVRRTHTGARCSEEIHNRRHATENSLQVIVNEPGWVKSQVLLRGRP